MEVVQMPVVPLRLLLPLLLVVVVVLLLGGACGLAWA